MIEKKENVVVKTAMKRKWSLLLTVLLDVAGTAGTIAVYYFIYKVIAEIVDKHAMVDEIDKSVITSMCIGMLICVVIAVALLQLLAPCLHILHLIQLDMSLEKASWKSCQKWNLVSFQRNEVAT